MFGLDTIKQLQLEAAQKAAAEHREPFVYWPGDPVEPPFPMPFLGDYEPPGWRRLGEARMVDSSGLGAEDEPALTVRAFREWVESTIENSANVTHGWSITTVAQFQVVVQCWRREEEDEFVARCPACGDAIDYCQGHGEIGDPEGHAILERHDAGDHEDCHPEGCEEAGQA